MLRRGCGQRLDTSLPPAKADGHKVVDFIIGMRSRWQSVASEKFITQRIAEVAKFAGVTADLYRRVVLD